MTLHTTRAILLRSHPWSETSRILRFLTPDLGIIGISARGVRRQSSKGETPLETFAQGELTLDWRPERELHPLRSFRMDPESRPRVLAQALLSFAGASFLAELLLVHALESNETGALHPIFAAALKGLESDPSDGTARHEVIVLSAAWQILSSFGFPPELDHCVLCGSLIEEETEGVVRFDLASGGLRCPRCATDAAGVRVGPGARIALRALVAGTGPKELLGAPAHFTLVERYAIHHLGLSRPFRASELLAEALRAKWGGAGAPNESTRSSEGSSEGSAEGSLGRASARLDLGGSLPAD